MNKEETHKTVEKLSTHLEYLKERYQEVYNDLESYYYKISLCNSSDTFLQWKLNNPNHEHVDKFKILAPISSGCLSNVLLRILKCDISREDFVSLAKEVVSPKVGNDDFFIFNYKHPIE